MLRRLFVLFFLALCGTTIVTQEGRGQPQAVPEPKPLPPAAMAVTGVDIAVERDRPQVCFAFNRSLARSRTRGYDAARYVSVEPQADITVTVRDRDLCLEGLAHGGTYAVTLAPGIAVLNGKETLIAPSLHRVAVPERRPSLSFRGEGYVLAKSGLDGLQLRSVNIERARIIIMRLSDASLARQIYHGSLNRGMTGFEAGDLLDRKGHVAWKGEIAIGGERNRAQQTVFPLDAALGTLPPGLYAAIAENAALPMMAWDQRATQWFAVSDIGLASLRTTDGLLLFAHSLTTGAPLPGVTLQLVNRRNAELAGLVTGPDGLAAFAPTALDGTGDQAPQVVFASDAKGGLSLLDLAGRDGHGGDKAATNEAAALLVPDRALYRPGDPVLLTGTLRNGDGQALIGARLALKLIRPDGLEIEQRIAEDAGGGGFFLRWGLPANAPPGRWTLAAYLENRPEKIGETFIQVGSTVPSRLEASLTADRPRIGADGKVQIMVDARYAHGAPTAGLVGEMEVRLRAPQAPLTGFEGFRFGLAQRPTPEERRSLPGFTLGTDGQARIAADIGSRPDASGRLEAVIRATIHDAGGRAIEREIVLPFDHQPFLIGLKPNFLDDAVPEGATVAIEAAAIGPDGQKLARSGIVWELFEEERGYDWFAADGRWDYRAQVRDRRLTGGTLDLQAGRSAILEEPVKAGRYRLEAFDPASGIASSLRFAAGWWASPRLGERPDRVEISQVPSPGGAAPPAWRPGETVRLFVRPPYPGAVVIALADRSLRSVKVETIGPEGKEVDFIIPAAMKPGAKGLSAVAAVFAAADPENRTPPRRAAGQTWIPLDPNLSSLNVSVAIPSSARPRSTLELPVAVTGMQVGETVRLAVVAVDESIAAINDSGSDPISVFLASRPLFVDLRDAQGPLRPPPSPAPLPAKAEGGRAGASVGMPVEQRSAAGSAPLMGAAQSLTPPVALASGIVTAEADGTAKVRLTLPDTQARLRLAVIAWTPTRLGRGTASLLVQDPVQVDLDLPGFLAPGDMAQVRLTAENLNGPNGLYKARLIAEGPARLERCKAETLSARLAPGQRRSVICTIVAGDPGYGVLTLNLEGPQGYALTRRFPVNVRPAHDLSFVSQRLIAPAGMTAQVPALDAPGPTVGPTLKALALSRQPLLDAPAHLIALDSRPFGSADQLAARLLPLTLPSRPAWQEMTQGLGLPIGEKAKAKADDLIERLIGRQRADGAFAPWSHEGTADPWLTAFAMDALTRAREAGFAVPEDGYRRGVEHLARMIAKSWVDDGELAARAYALYAAARARAIDAAPLRFFLDRFGARLPTRLARAQLGAAFALLGEGGQAAAIFARLDDPLPADLAYGRDYGSPLRDRAAILALLIGANADTGRISAETAALQAFLPNPVQVATQERAWLLAAAHALAERSGQTTLAARVGGAPINAASPHLLRLEGVADKTIAIANQAAPGSQEQGLLHIFSFASALAKEGSGPVTRGGLSLSRRILNLKGRPIATARIKAGELVAVVLEGRAESLSGSDRPLVLIDPLPGGLVVENVRAAGSPQRGDLSWLGSLSEASLLEFREDRFVAALDRMPEDGSFRLVYLARAVHPGVFTLPAARLDDLTDGHRAARTASGTITVIP
jgi:alpha-2-macroglobulin